MFTGFVHRPRCQIFFVKQRFKKVHLVTIGIPSNTMTFELFSQVRHKDQSVLFNQNYTVIVTTSSWSIVKTRATQQALQSSCFSRSFWHFLFKMRKPRLIHWLFLVLFQVCAPQEISIQAQLNQLAKRVTTLENEVKTLKVRYEMQFSQSCHYYVTHLKTSRLKKLYDH